jgi:hypothetical protein
MPKPATRRNFLAHFAQVETTMSDKQTTAVIPRRTSLDVVDEKLNDLREIVRAVIASSSLPDTDGEVMTLEDLLRCERLRLRLSLQDVADASGMTKGHVWEVEAGRSRNPTVKCLYGLSLALGIPFMNVCRSALKSLEIADVKDAA